MIVCNGFIFVNSKEQHYFKQCESFDKTALLISPAYTLQFFSNAAIIGGFMSTE